MVAYSFKPKFVGPIQAGLGVLPVIDGHPAEFVLDAGSKFPRAFVPVRDLDPPVRPKRQTIRAHGKRRHARPGDELQLYTGMRTKACRLIGRAQCTEVKSIILWFEEGSVAAQINGEILGPRKMKSFAQADGFKDTLEMAAFWSHENGTRNGDKWKGLLILWAPLPAERQQS